MNRLYSLLLVLAVTSVAGCGDRAATPKGSPGEVIRRSAVVTGRARTMHMQIAARDGSVDVKIDRSRGRYNIVIRGAVARRLKIAEVTFFDGYLYIKRTSQGWEQLQPADPESQLVLPGRIPISDPAAVVDLLLGAKDVEAYGGAEVQGVTTTRYDVVVDADRARAVTQTRRRDVIARLSTKKASIFPVDVWVDGMGRARRIQFPSRLSVTSTTLSDSGVPLEVVTVDFGDFNKAVRIKRPTIVVRQPHKA